MRQKIFEPSNSNFDEKQEEKVCENFSSKDRLGAAGQKREDISWVLRHGSNRIHEGCL